MRTLSFSLTLQILRNTKRSWRSSRRSPSIDPAFDVICLEATFFRVRKRTKNLVDVEDALRLSTENKTHRHHAKARLCDKSLHLISFFLTSCPFTNLFPELSEHRLFCIEPMNNCGLEIFKLTKIAASNRLHSDTMTTSFLVTKSVTPRPFLS